MIPVWPCKFNLSEIPATQRNVARLVFCKYDALRRRKTEGIHTISTVYLIENCDACVVCNDKGNRCITSTPFLKILARDTYLEVRVFTITTATGTRATGAVPYRAATAGETATRKYRTAKTNIGRSIGWANHRQGTAACSAVVAITPKLNFTIIIIGGF